MIFLEKAKKKRRALLIAVLAMAVAVLCLSPGAQAATPEEIEAAIAKGLTWLVAQQAGNGSFPGYYPIANTAAAVLKLEDRAKELGYNSPFDPSYPYKTNVENGLTYLLSQAHLSGTQVWWEYYGSETTYHTALGIMAIVSSTTPDTVVASGPLSGLTYGQVVTYALNFLLARQNPDGGWIYTSGGGSDQSNTGFAGLGLAYANSWGNTLPAATINGLKNWNAYIQCTSGDVTTNGGAGYTSPCYWVNAYKTGHLLYNMALVGDGAGNPAVQAAITYIANNWNDTNNIGWRYYGGTPDMLSCFMVMKGLVGQGIERINVGGNPNFDWFDDMSTVLVNTQQVNGNWVGNYWTDDLLTTVFALLTLEKTIIKPFVSAYFDIKPGYCPNVLNIGGKIKRKAALYTAVCGLENFDVRDIDPDTIRLSREDNPDLFMTPTKVGYRDVATPYEGSEECGCTTERGDGYMDLVILFNLQTLISELELNYETGNTVPLVLTANLTEEAGGMQIIGRDCLVISGGQAK